MSLVVSAQQILADLAGDRDTWTPDAERDQLLTPHHARYVLRVSAKTLVRLAEDGRLSTVRTPLGHRRYLAADVYDLAESRTGTALSRPGSGEDGGPAPLSSGPGRQH